MEENIAGLPVGPAGIVGPTLASHLGNIQLHRDHHSGKYYLEDSRTREVAEILPPPLDETWELRMYCST